MVTLYLCLCISIIYIFILYIPFQFSPLFLHCVYIIPNSLIPTHIHYLCCFLCPRGWFAMGYKSSTICTIWGEHNNNNYYYYYWIVLQWSLCNIPYHTVSVVLYLAFGYWGRLVYCTPVYAWFNHPHHEQHHYHYKI